MIIETKTTSITIDHHSTSLPSVPNEIFLTSLSTCTPKSEELVDEIEIFQTRSPTPLLVKSTISPLSPDQIEPAAKRSDNLGQVSSSSPCSPLPVNDLAAQGLTIPTKASTALSTCETRSTETSLASPHPEQSPPNQPDDLTTTEPLTRSPPVEITSPPVPAPLCSTKSQTFEHLEECIISSSVEDHHYCSLTELSQDTTPSKVLDSVPSPRLECPAGPSISKPLTNPANSKRSKFKSTKPPSSKKSKSPNSKVTSTRATKAKSANSSDSIQLGNDCFKRFYLQRQLDGTFVIVPFGAPSKSVKALKTFTLASTSASELCHKSPVIILNEHSLKLNPTELTIQIDKSNLLTQLSLTDSKESPATMSALVNNKASQFGPLRPSANHFQQSTPQNRAILSALKHDHLIASSMAQLTSPPPVVTSSSFKMEEVDNYQIGQNGNANYLVQNQQNMIDQNMLVASLPPVETIFPGDRSIMNGSLANLQQSEENDQMGNTFAPTTIINDHHIDFYDHVDSTVDEDDELLSNPKYLPFGYYYDDDKVFNQLQMISSSLPSSTTSSPVLDGFDPLNDLFGSSTDKSEENMFINNEDFISYPNEMAFELDQSFGMQSSNRRTSPLCQTNAQSMMLTCDNDPLISGSDLGNSNSTKNVTYLKSVGLPSNGTAPVMLARGKGISQNTFSPMPDLNGQLFNSNQLTGDNGETLLVENGHLYAKKSSPMIIRTAADPTLAQLNLQLPMKEEDEDLLNWATSNQNGFANVTLPRNSSLLACGNVVDLNGQQHNMISSTSSPTAKTNPMAITNDKNFWFQTGMNGNLNSVVNGGNVLTSNGVTSTMLEELCVSEMDDTSLEIEAILQQSQMQMNGYGSQSNLASPPKLSSSLHMANFKSPSVHKQKIKKPNFVMPRNGDQKTLLGELLSSNNPNVSEILRSNSNPMVINVNQLNLVPKSNQMSSMSATSPQNGMANFPKVNRGKSMFNCPTLTALITSPNVNANMSPMLSSTALMNTNISNGPNMATILAHNNRIRNNSMSTDYSVSSHDEGFASQPDEESEESDDNSEEMMLINDGTDDLIDSDLFYLDNTVGNSLLNTALTNNSDDNNVAMNSNNNNSNSQELLTNSNVALVSAMANAVSADMLTTVKQEDEPVLWSSAPANLNQMQIKSEHYQQSKASTSSAIDDNESIGSDEEDDDDESFYGDYDASDLLGATTSDDMNNKWSLNMGRSRKGSEKRYFWQYNVQSKGPKGPRFNGPASSFENEDEDPHVFNEIADPVFAPDCQVEGVKHSGKARRGDGNDLTPNPKKLLMIGLELKKLSKTINDLTPVTDVPFTCRNKSRKEKNKLASRACRLKKKAQHEANKIKLHGLQREHMKLNKMIEEVRKIVDIGMKMKDVKKPMLLSIDGVTYQLTSEANIGSLMDEIVNRHKPNFEVSGRTAEFVNHILDNVSSGVSNGGIEGV